MSYSVLSKYSFSGASGIDIASYVPSGSDVGSGFTYNTTASGSGTLIKTDGAGGVYLQTAGSNGFGLVYDDTQPSALSDVNIQSTFEFLAYGDAALALRQTYNGPWHYLGYLNASGFQIFYVDGGYSSLGTYSYTPTDSTLLSIRFEVRTGQQRLLFDFGDGVGFKQVLAATHTTLTGGAGSNYHGIRLDANYGANTLSAGAHVGNYLATTGDVYEGPLGIEWNGNLEPSTRNEAYSSAFSSSFDSSVLDAQWTPILDYELANSSGVPTNRTPGIDGFIIGSPASPIVYNTVTVGSGKYTASAYSPAGGTTNQYLAVPSYGLFAADQWTMTFWLNCPGNSWSNTYNYIILSIGDSIRSFTIANNGGYLYFVWIDYTQSPLYSVTHHIVTNDGGWFQSLFAANVWIQFELRFYQGNLTLCLNGRPIQWADGQWTNIPIAVIGSSCLGVFGDGVTISTNPFYEISDIQILRYARTPGIEFEQPGWPYRTINATGGGIQTFVTADTVTQGTWTNIYGNDGYSIFSSIYPANLPSYVNLSIINGSVGIWDGNNSDVRALQPFPNGSSRFASYCVNNTSYFTLNLNFNDGRVHQVALYLVDWDSTIRTETVQVTDATTNAVLDIQFVSGFHNGKWLVWNLGGNVNITVTNTSSSNAVASGIFFDPVSGTVPLHLRGTSVCPLHQFALNNMALSLGGGGVVQIDKMESACPISSSVSPPPTVGGYTYIVGASGLYSYDPRPMYQSFLLQPPDAIPYMKFGSFPSILNGSNTNLPITTGFAVINASSFQGWNPYPPSAGANTTAYVNICSDLYLLAKAYCSTNSIVSPQYITLGNEVDGAQYWIGTQAQYMALLGAFADQMHTTDVNCKIIAFGGTSPLTAPTWFNDATNGLLYYMPANSHIIDGVEFHDYSGQSLYTTANVAALDAMMTTASYPNSLEIINGETGPSGYMQPGNSFGYPWVNLTIPQTMWWGCLFATQTMLSVIAGTTNVPRVKFRLHLQTEFNETSSGYGLYGLLGQSNVGICHNFYVLWKMLEGMHMLSVPTEIWPGVLEMQCVDSNRNVWILLVRFRGLQDGTPFQVTYNFSNTNWINVTKWEINKNVANYFQAGTTNANLIPTILSNLDGSNSLTVSLIEQHIMLLKVGQSIMVPILYNS